MKNIKKLVLALSVIVFWGSCKNKMADYDGIFNNRETYSKSVYEFNTGIMGNNFSLVVGSRNYLYANVAAYEVMAANNMAKFNSLSGQLKGLGKIPLPDPAKKINTAFAFLLAF